MRRSSVPGTLATELRTQDTLGRAVTRIEVPAAPGAGLPDDLFLQAAPFMVLVGARPGSAPVPWMLSDQAQLDRALSLLHADLLADVRTLTDLLRPLTGTDPERPPSRAVQRVLRRLLGLRSLLELAAAWQGARSPGGPAGWASGPGRGIPPALPWHLMGPPRVAGDTWHLHDLRRWHWDRGAADWAGETARHVGTLALLMDADLPTAARLPTPLAHSRGARDGQRARIRSGKGHHFLMEAPALDRDPAAFVRRVRLALGTLLEPALLCFEPDEVRRATPGARSGAVALGRLLPGVAPGAAGALAAAFRQELGGGGHVTAGEGTRPAEAAGPVPVRRTAWTAARAGGASPARCLAAEAAAGPLHQLLPGLLRTGPASALVRHGLAERALEEVADLFSAVSALAAGQVLPLPDLAGLLTGRGFLRLARHAPEDAEHLDDSGDPGEEPAQAALRLVPGLVPAIAALQAVTDDREQTLARVTADACRGAGISEAEFDAALGGEQAFALTEHDHGLERTLAWGGGHWSLLLARHPRELVADGGQLAHCVGWGGYAQAVQAGQARIVRVLDHGDDGTPTALLTLELRPGGREPAQGRPRWTLHQARGLHNRLPGGREAQLLGLWAAEVGVQVGAGSGVTPLERDQGRAAVARLHVCWERPARPDLPEAPSAGRIEAAGAHRAAALLACWTPGATRRHQEGLRRISLLVERARLHLEAELTRLHDAGDTLLVGTTDGDDLLRGVGPLTLPPDPRPLWEALPEGPLTPGGWTGLRARRRVSLVVDPALRAREDLETLELRRDSRFSDLRLTYGRPWRAPLTSTLSRELAQRSGLLEMGLPAEAGVQGVAARRQPAFRFLGALLDEPLGALEVAATAATGQAGGTLRDQLTAWLEAPTPARRRRPGVEAPQASLLT